MIEPLGARRSRRRPLGAGRFRRHRRRARPQPRPRIPPQPRALRVPQMGRTGLRHLQGRAARHRHRPPGEPRIPRQVRARKGRRVLSGHPRRHRLPHHHDQRPRRRRLGRGRHRGGSRHARPAGHLPRARKSSASTSPASSPAGVTATDLVLRVTEVLRKTKVVGKFVEFYGPGAKALSLPDRATIANMAPEYGATMGFFGIDEITTGYLAGTGRPPELCQTVENYYKAQGLWGIPTDRNALDFSQIVDLDLSTVQTQRRRPEAPAGPHRPRLAQGQVGRAAHRARTGRLQQTARYRFHRTARSAAHPRRSCRTKSTGIGHAFGAEVGRGHRSRTTIPSYPLWEVTVDSKGGVQGHHHPRLRAHRRHHQLHQHHATRASCSPPACSRKRPTPRASPSSPAVKTSLGPGSRVVTDYLNKTGLQAELDQLGFQTVGYGCTTCIGNSGPLDPGIEDVVKSEDIIAASVLSGNRNFEARVHQTIKANFLMSPPLVVAFAIAGTVDIDLTTEPLGFGTDGHPVFLARHLAHRRGNRSGHERRRSSPTSSNASTPASPTRIRSGTKSNPPPATSMSGTASPPTSRSRRSSTASRPTPRDIAEINGARPLGIFGDSVTTDHISPAGAIKKDSPAGRFLTEQRRRRRRLQLATARAAATTAS